MQSTEPISEGPRIDLSPELTKVLEEHNRLSDKVQSFDFSEQDQLTAARDALDQFCKTHKSELNEIDRLQGQGDLYSATGELMRYSIDKLTPKSRGVEVVTRRVRSKIQKTK